MTSALWVLIFSLLVFHQASALFLEENCGVVDSKTNFYPWLAKVGTKVNNEVICTGTLIQKRNVLTTASCLVDREELVVCLGKCESSMTDNRYEVHDVIMVFIHESYLSSSHQNDIGLLRLPTNVEYKPHIKPMCIVLNPQQTWPKSRINSFLFGLNSKQKSYKFLCSGLPCKSVGNPLSIMSKTKNVIQHGILSYRNATTYGLVYTNVMAHVEWITSRALDVDVILSNYSPVN